MFKKAFSALVSWVRNDPKGPGYSVLSFEGPGFIKVDPADIFSSPEFREQLEQVKQIAENGG